MLGRATPTWVSGLLAGHALFAFVMALVCYLAPEGVFGDTAWLPLGRFAAALLAAALLTLAALWWGAARAGESSIAKVALFGALVFDLQLPILMAFHPAFLDYLEKETAIPWYLVPLGIIFLGFVPVLAGRRELDRR